jgi:hypothetical protein
MHYCDNEQVRQQICLCQGSNRLLSRDTTAPRMDTGYLEIREWRLVFWLPYLYGSTGEILKAITSCTYR